MAEEKELADCVAGRAVAVTCFCCEDTWSTNEGVDDFNNCAMIMSAVTELPFS